MGPIGSVQWVTRPTLARPEKVDRLTGDADAYPIELIELEWVINAPVKTSWRRTPGPQSTPRSSERDEIVFSRPYPGFAPDRSPIVVR